MSLLEARGLSISLGARKVLDNVSFGLPAGEVTGLVGPNGAGKSTLLKILARLLRPSEGEILLEGVPSENISQRVWARETAYLAQERVVHWPLTARAIVALGRTPHAGKDEAIVDEALKMTGTAALAHRPFRELAGGEKALVLLARCLAVDARVLLADEPVSALDPAHELQAMEILRSTARRGRGVLVVLHNLALAARFCDRLFLLDQGKITAGGRPEEVLTPENLRRSYGVEAVYGPKGAGFYVLPWQRI
ncbi:MAG TPA: ABC transporter ATP-binding protein [Verrucomicrobiae bacterium]|nr:ABC transporter ATP-binding protein [Verrucomicrobiae bacterium]